MFQSTLPTRGSDDVENDENEEVTEFQSTLPTRGSDNKGCNKSFSLSVSIHAPHEGERRKILLNK